MEIELKRFPIKEFKGWESILVMSSNSEKSASLCCRILRAMTRKSIKRGFIFTRSPNLEAWKQYKPSLTSIEIHPAQDFTTSVCQDIFLQQGFQFNDKSLGQEEIDALNPLERKDYLENVHPATFLPKDILPIPSKEIFLHVNKFLIIPKTILILHWVPRVWRTRNLSKMMSTGREENRILRILCLNSKEEISRKILSRMWIIIYERDPTILENIFKQLNLKRWFKNKQVFIDINQLLQEDEGLLLEPFPLVQGGQEDVQKNKMVQPGVFLVCMTPQKTTILPPKNTFE